MPQDIKRGSKIVVVEGIQCGMEGTVTLVQREYDKDDRVTRWMVWADGQHGDRIKTRLSWVREVA